MSSGPWTLPMSHIDFNPIKMARVFTPSRSVKDIYDHMMVFAKTHIPDTEYDGYIKNLEKYYQEALKHETSTAASANLTNDLSNVSVSHLSDDESCSHSEDSMDYDIEETSHGVSTLRIFP